MFVAFDFACVAIFEPFTHFVVVGAALFAAVAAIAAAAATAAVPIVGGGIQDDDVGKATLCLAVSKDNTLLLYC